ncbi:hypothetical protein D3C85_414170 [compost metagenome]
MAAKALLANALSSCASESMMAATEPAPKWRSSAARAAASEETPACAWNGAASALMATGKASPGVDSIRASSAPICASGR